MRAILTRMMWMTPDTLLAVIAFAAVTSVTPGPNNMMLLASGVNHGFRPTLPHMLGISVGFFVLMLAAGLGLGALLLQWPQLHLALKVLGIGYMVWLAWKLLRAGAPTASASVGAPMGFWAAAAFQWVNPKAWMMAIGAVAGFTAPEGGLAAMLLLAGVCAVVNLPCVSLWAFAGDKMSRHLAMPARRRAFNALMALLLLASIWPILKA